jgi:diguanylate cyclase (GGDEF)-like protein/hemerythrin-like metal-binding protein/PAS domain S-box-containing protein
MIDIHTLALVLGITNLLQVLALFVQYRLAKPLPGLGWWTLGSLFEALGFAFNFVRDTPGPLGSMAIIANNVLFLSALAFFFIGLKTFLRAPVKSQWLLAIAVPALLAILYFTYLHPDLGGRRIAGSIALAALSLACAWLLHQHKTRAIASSATSLSVVFGFTGVFFLLRMLATLSDHPVNAIFSPTLAHSVIYLVILTVSTLWTFGFIILVNQRLNSEHREDKENLRVIFNTSPDAVSINRASDGIYVDCNERFSDLSKFSREEIIGRTSLEIQVWNDPNDRERLVSCLREKGSCEAFEADFRRKDASVINGLMSAKIIPLQGVPHIISVTRDITERKLAERQIQGLVRQLEIEKNYAQTIAMTDGLTKIANRRYFDEILNTEFFRQKRSRSPLSLILLDIDNFKQFNDTCGHLAGDDCLKQIGASLKVTVGRAPDMVARYGGEEFVVILPETDHRGAVTLANRIRKNIQELSIPHPSSETSAYVTASLGVATLDPSKLDTTEQALNFADTALYRAKKGGRNRVETINAYENSGQAPVNTESGFVQMIWNIAHDCGNPLIDEQHRRLFESSNELLSAMIQGKAKEECASSFARLLADIVTHFNDEESLFQATAYPDADSHSKIHAELVERATVLAGKFQRDELTLGELVSFLIYDVVNQHMFKTDLDFFPYIQGS